MVFAKSLRVNVSAACATASSTAAPMAYGAASMSATPKEEERKREMGEKGRKLLEERLAKKAAEEANEA